MAAPRARGIGAGAVLKLIFGALMGTAGGLFGLALIGMVAERGLPKGAEAGDVLAALSILGVLSLGGLIGGVLLFRAGLHFHKKGWNPSSPTPPLQQ